MDTQHEHPHPKTILTPDDQPIPTLAGGQQAVTDEITVLCRRLRLRYIREQSPDVLLTAKAQRWDPAETLRVLLQAEAEGRNRSTIEAHRETARFPAGKTFDAWQQAERSSVPVPTQNALQSLEWVDRHENLVICGPSGTGKSHLCEALGQSAVDHGRNVRWFNIEDLGALVRSHRIDDTINRALKPILKADLVVVDDIGLSPVSTDAAEGLYRLIDAAYENTSVAVSSNLHPSGFNQLMDETLASPLVDRLLHHAHVIVTQGESIRLEDALCGTSPRRSRDHRQALWLGHENTETTQIYIHADLTIKEQALNRTTPPRHQPPRSLPTQKQHPRLPQEPVIMPNLTVQTPCPPRNPPRSSA